MLHYLEVSFSWPFYTVGTLLKTLPNVSPWIHVVRNLHLDFSPDVWKLTSLSKDIILIVAPFK